MKNLFYKIGKKTAKKVLPNFILNKIRKKINNKKGGIVLIEFLVILGVVCGMLIYFTTNAREPINKTLTTVTDEYTNTNTIIIE